MLGCEPAVAAARPGKRMRGSFSVRQRLERTRVLVSVDAEKKAGLEAGFGIVLPVGLEVSTLKQLGGEE